jgi:hypothetical protein
MGVLLDLGVRYGHQLTAKILRVEAARPESPGRLIRFAGRLVGTAALYSSQGVAGVYVLSTLKEHRARG